MTIYVDNNISYRIARGLNHISSALTRKAPFDVSIIALRDSDFGHDAPDATWIPLVAERGDWMFTQDVNIKKQTQEKALLRQHGVNVVFLRSSVGTGGYWRMVERTIKAWPWVIDAVMNARGSTHTAIEIDLKDKVTVQTYDEGSTM